MPIEFGRSEPKWPADSRLHEVPSERRGNQQAKSFQIAAARTGSATEVELAERITGEYRKADLASAEKLDQMVRATVRELVEANTAMDAALTTKQREQVMDLLAEDPGMRKRIEQYLAKVLK